MRKAHRLTALMLCCVLILCAGCAAAEKTITITFTGDCTLGSEESTRKDPYSFDSTAEKEGYDYFFRNFREMFENDDLTVINFEGVLSDSKAMESQRKRYRFRGPTDFVKILTQNSVEAACLSNNHIGDYGKQGEKSTKETLEAAGVAWFQNFKTWTFEKDGVKIAFIAMENKAVYNEFDKLKRTLISLKESGEANAIVVCWHTGLEYRGAHEDNTERTAKAMIKYGADLVIMHHPHVLQGVEIANNRGIFYSLGNFVFGGNDEIREEDFQIGKKVTSLYCIVVQAKLTFSNEGTYLGQQEIIYPVYTSSGGILRENIQLNNYQPYRVNAEDAVPILDALQVDTKFDLPEITTDESGLSRIELPYLPAFEEAMIPEEEEVASGPQGVPEAASAAPTRSTKGK